MAQKILIWTCVCVFVSTSIITLLGIINKIKIDKSYLSKLFIALILEVVAIGVLAFKDSFNTEAKTDFVKITMPDPGLDYYTATSNTLSIKGAYMMLQGHSIHGYIRVKDKINTLTNISASKNVFLYSLHNTDLVVNEKAIIKVTVKENNKVLSEDSIIVSVY